MSETERTLGREAAPPAPHPPAPHPPAAGRLDTGVLLDLGQQAELLALLAWSIGTGRPDTEEPKSGKADNLTPLAAFGDWAGHTATDLAVLLDPRP